MAPATPGHLDFHPGGSDHGAALSESDRAAYPLFLHKYRRFAGILRKTFTSRPPRVVNNNIKELARLAGLGLNMRLLGKYLMRELMRTGAINIYDVLQETFTDERLKGALGMDALLGANLGPPPGSVLTYLYRLTGRRFVHLQPQTESRRARNVCGLVAKRQNEYRPGLTGNALGQAGR